MPDWTGPEGDRARRRIGRAALALAAALAALVLASWAVRLFWGDSPGRDDLPMAPSSALLMLAISWAGARPAGTRLPFARAAVGLAATATGLLAAVGILGAFERAALESVAVVSLAGSSAGFGKMSPLSGVAFILIGFALLTSTARHAAQRQAGSIASLLATLLASTVAVGYAIHVPLLYGASVPMAPTSSLAIVALGVGLLLTGASDIWPVSLLSGEGHARPTGEPRSSSIALGLVVSASVLIATASYISQSWNDVRRDAQEELEAAADSRSRDVAAWVRERLGNAQLIHDGELLGAELQAFLAEPPAAVPQAGDDARDVGLRGWAQSLRAAFGYRAVVLYDAQGIERLREGGSGGVNPEALLRALTSDTVVLVDVDGSDPQPTRTLSFLAPLRGKGGTGRPMGVVALVVDARIDLFPMLDRWPFRSRSAQLLLVRRDGDSAVYLSDPRTRGADGQPMFRLPVSTPGLAVARALEGEQGPFSGVDYRGVRVLASSRAVVGAPWLIVAQEDLDQVYAPFWSDVRRATAFAGLLIIATAFGLAIVSRQQDLARLRATLVVDRARQDSDERLRAALAASIDGFLMLDEEGHITESNLQAERLLGWERGALHAQRLAGSLAPPFDAQMSAALAAGRLGQGHPLLETRVAVEARRHDGTRFPAELAVVRIRLHERMAFSAVLRDISEQVRAEAAVRSAQAEAERLLAEAERAGRALLNIVEDQRRTEAALRDSETLLETRVRQRTEQLEAANRELEAFSYSVSHDLRAPLRAIDGYARMLAEDSASRLDAEGLRRLGVVQQEAQRMGALIDDLLRFSRLGRQPLEHSEVDMTSLAREVAGDLTRDLGGRAVDLLIDDLPSVHGDRALLRQVWSNLLGNALKFTATRDRAEIRVGGEQTNGDTTYVVRDNGVGFDMRYADKLFGVFQRLHGQDQFEGTGVGLALAQRIVARHGGRMWAEAAVNRGAIFHFTLPSAGPQEAAA